MKLNYLDLSTAHLSPETREELTVGSINGCTVAPYEYGVFVTVPGSLEDIDELQLTNEEQTVFSPCPPELVAVLRHAHGEGCHLVRFDSDADVIEGLPYFED